jgi:hypothetical protein
LSLPLILLGQAREALDLLRQRQENVDRLADGRLVGLYYFRCAHAAQHLGERELAARSAERAVQEGPGISSAYLCGPNGLGTSLPASEAIRDDTVGAGRARSGTQCVD